MPPTDQILRCSIKAVRSNPNIEMFACNSTQFSFSLKEVFGENCSLSCRKDKQLTLKKLLKLNQIVGFLSEKYNDVESEEVISIQLSI